MQASCHPKNDNTSLSFGDIKSAEPPTVDIHQMRHPPFWTHQFIQISAWDPGCSHLLWLQPVAGSGVALRYLRLNSTLDLYSLRQGSKFFFSRFSCRRKQKRQCRMGPTLTQFNSAFSIVGWSCRDDLHPASQKAP